MTDSERNGEAAIKARLKEMGLDTSEPVWSSWVLDRLLENAVSGPGGLVDLFTGLNASLRDWSVQLTKAVANLLQNLVVMSFSRYGSAYRAMDWRWANAELKNKPSPACCYLFLHALPPEAATPGSILTILRGLKETAYGQEALNTLSDDLEKPEVRRLLGPDDERLVGTFAARNGEEKLRPGEQNPRDPIPGPASELPPDLAEDLARVREAAPPSPMNPQARTRIQEAYDAYERGDLGAALALVRRWYRYIPPAEFAYLRGSISHRGGDYAAAALFYGRAAELEPGNANYARLHLNTLSRSNPSEAITRARAILADAEKQHPGLVVTAGDVQLMSIRSLAEQDAQPAYRELHQTLERTLARLRAGEGRGSAQSSTTAMALALLGFCRDHLGDTEGALQYYDAGLAAFPSNDALLVARGILRYGTNDAAAMDFQKAIDCGSPVVWPYFFLAHQFLVNNRSAECLTMCERALQMPASDVVRANLFEWLAISRAELGWSPEKVQTAFEAAIRLDPENARIRKNYRAFEDSLREGVPALRVWEKPEPPAMRACGRTEFQLTTGAWAMAA